MHDADTDPGKHDPLVVQTGHQHPDALSFGAHDILGRDVAIGEDEFAGVGAAHPELVQLLRRREPVEAFLDQEGGDALRPCGRVGLGVDHQHIRVWTVGDPHLAAIQDVAVATFLGPQRHRDDIRPGAGLRHGERSDMLARTETGQIAGLLARRGVPVDLVDAEVGMGAIAQCRGGRGSGHFLDGDDMGKIAQPGTAELRIGRDAEEPERAELRPEIARKLVAAIDLVGAGTKPLLGETLDGLAYRLDLLADCKSHRCVKHRSPPRARLSSGEGWGRPAPPSMTPPASSKDKRDLRGRKTAGLSTWGDGAD